MNTAQIFDSSIMKITLLMFSKTCKLLASSMKTGKVTGKMRNWFQRNNFMFIYKGVCLQTA